MPEVCREWEAAAEPAVKAGIRTAFLRTGIVLSGEGGALKQMLPPFRMGLGGKIEVEDSAAFDRRLAMHGVSTHDLLVAALDFSPACYASSFEWIERALAPPAAPPLVVVADHGDEVAAATVMRSGAADYLPRHLLNADRLGSSLRLGRRISLADGITQGRGIRPQIPDQQARSRRRTSMTHQRILQTATIDFIRCRSRLIR